MLLSGRPKDEIIEVHGGVVWREAAEMLAQRPKRY
jgi:hypothetical protein